jgi:hypothetical protein
VPGRDGRRQLRVRRARRARVAGIGAADLATVVVTHIHALASLERFRSLRSSRLLFSHYGPLTPVGETLDRSAEELRVWVELVTEAYDQRLDLDHAVAMVQERTDDRYQAAAVDADPDTARKVEFISAARNNVAGIIHALEHG